MRVPGCLGHRSPIYYIISGLLVVIMSEIVDLGISIHETAVFAGAGKTQSSGAPVTLG